MRYEYTLTFVDYKAAQRLFNQQTRKQRFNIALWLFVMPILGLIALGLLLSQVLSQHLHHPPLLIGILAGLAYIGLRGAIMRPFVLRRMFRDLSPDGVGDRAFSFEFTGTELISRNPGKSESRFFRQHFAELPKTKRSYSY